MDCEFLQDVFRIFKGDMLRHFRRDAGIHNDFEVAVIWYRDELTLTRYEPKHEIKASSVNTESSQADPSWSTWVEFHGHTAVIRLLGNGR
jgi:hypothetical protein